MKNNIFVPQFSNNECGLCCVLMILKYYGINEDIFNLRRKIAINRDGMSIVQVSKLLNEYMIETKIYKCESTFLKTKKIKFPIIAYWTNSHFIVIYKVKNNNFYVLDPLLGELILSYEEFNNLFSNIILVPNLTNRLLSHNKNKKTYIFAEYYKKNFLYVFIILIFSLSFNITSIIIPIIIGNYLDNSVLIDYRNMIFSYS